MICKAMHGEWKKLYRLLTSILVWTKDVHFISTVFTLPPARYTMCTFSGVSRELYGCPETPPPPGHDFFKAISIYNNYYALSMCKTVLASSVEWLDYRPITQ